MASHLETFTMTQDECCKELSALELSCCSSSGHSQKNQPLLRLQQFWTLHNQYNYNEGGEKQLTKQVEDLISGEIPGRTLEHAVVILVSIQNISAEKKS